MRLFSVAAVLAASSSLVSALTWSSTKFFFIFGDSYTDDGYRVTNGINSAVPGFTSSNGPNWAMFLSSTFNATNTSVYNLAWGGATTDSALVTPFESTVHSFVDQVNTFNEVFTPAPAEAPWQSSNSLFAVFIGINDVGNSWDWTNVTQHGFHITLLNRYFGQVEDLFAKGARNFLFINVPPIDRAPLFIEQGKSNAALVKSSLADYNAQFAQRVSQFKSTHRGLGQVVLFDANKFFDTLLDNAPTFGFVNSTGFCEAYENGTPLMTTQVLPCAPVSQYFWLNTLHPLFTIHFDLARAIATALS